MMIDERDSERWRWVKEHPRFAVDLFDVQWMEQRDFDAAIDAAMQQEAKPKPCAKCTACGDQTLQAKQDQCGLPFCDKCYEEMRRGCNEE
jgi:formylmethanofuran dehydrogenase subunit E